MAKQFKKLGQNLFCQDFLMQNALNYTNQWLQKLNRQVDFTELWQKKLLAAYKGQAEIGQPPYAPEIMLKMLFLAYLFNVSERDIERVINDSISMKAFLGLAFDEAAPDHSSLTKFKDRILEYQKYREQDLFKEIFDDIIVYAQNRGIDLRYTQAIDSTHTVANVNTAKDKQRQKPRDEDGEGKSPRDPNAKWGVKRVKKVKTTDGKEVMVPELYYGYKSHLSVNTGQNLITSYAVTAMNVYDGHYFERLMRDDLKKGAAIPLLTTYTADKGYDDGENHVWLIQEKLKDAIALKDSNKYGKTSAGKTKAFWKQWTTQAEFELGLKERYVVERINADCKWHHGLNRARYLGLAKMKIQTSLTSLTHNLKTLVKLWTGAGLRAPLTAHVS